ncbi:SAM-dependent methyltransferase [Mycobacterium sp. OTB74]|uniref:SAM-dependent methyltransferase n=1 Tax=Mycobacterium sp. OTB74 TaxID=1853452 RepID=UPI00247341BC|nr:SAM-dependent methyltransferase [Mycobacterium sp. OTB74]MDH6247143.1 methyltransferase (TIGR00027 family) [Mycobacterium sp. OTB74]
MTRADDDTWDITQSVGATAFGCAEWRARESEHEHPLFADPYAQFFLDEATTRGGSSVIHTNLFPWLHQNHPHLLRQVLAVGAYNGSRTKWFDDFFTAAGATVAQAVILAAGLDARAWRLPWKPGTAVYEIDQPAVLAFKTETLRSHEAEPVARYIAVGIDLRQDWPKALCDAGFNPNQPTAWSAEGLMAYLPATAQDLLFDRIHGLSATGSCIAVDAITAAFYQPENVARLKAFYDELRHAVIEGGDDMPEFPALWYKEERTEVADWLQQHGWHVEAIGVHDMMARYERAVSEEEAVGIPECVLVTGRLD